MPQIETCLQFQRNGELEMVFMWDAESLWGKHKQEVVLVGIYKHD